MTASRPRLKLTLVFAAAGLMLAGCASPPVPVSAPVLAFEGGACTTAPDLALAMTPADFPKSFKRMSSRRQLEMDADVGVAMGVDVEGGTACLSGGASPRPYRVFRLPPMRTGTVVTAGGVYTDGALFAADVSVLDASGRTVQDFAERDYRRYSDIHGVQFAPTKDAAYILLAADPARVGQDRDSSEFRPRSYSVLPSGRFSTPDPSQGDIVLGEQTDVERVFSYAGKAAVHVVFPKQRKPKS